MKKENEKWTSKVNKVAPPWQYKCRKQSLCIYCFCDLRCSRAHWPAGCYWEPLRGGGASVTLATGRDNSPEEKCCRVVRKAGSARRPGRAAQRAASKRRRFSERVAALHAVQKLINGWGSGVSHYPECNLEKKYRVTGWRLGAPSTVPTARLEALLYRWPWPHTYDSGQPEVRLHSSPQTTSLLRRKKALSAIGDAEPLMRLQKKCCLH